VFFPNQKNYPWAMKWLIEQIKYLIFLAVVIGGIVMFFIVVDALTGVSTPTNGDWNSPIENPSVSYP